VLSARGLCDELITRSEKSYRLWCVVVCDLGTTRMRRPWQTGGCVAPKETKGFPSAIKTIDDCLATTFPDIITVSVLLWLRSYKHHVNMLSGGLSY
jgi:hypothetical protein